MPYVDMIEAVDSLDYLTLTMALRFVVRFMGNGVMRLVACDLLPLDQARVEAALPGREPMMFPYPAGMFDMGVEALSRLGIPWGRASSWIVDASTRLIDDETVEVIGWRK